ncbi:MAG TPA: tetratricopeptide repeat protein [Tepidisphaeraceae bacterium]|nr:tetratricopeptide repeat protein [Tepidisphaeraceae bacterium]
MSRDTRFSAFPRADRLGGAGEHPHPRIARYAPLLLIAITLGIFGAAFTADFTTWDDLINVSANSRLNPVTVASVLAFWQKPFLDLYIPLTYTVWAGLAAVSRVPTPDGSGFTLNPYIFHAANLLVHSSAVMLAYAILKLATGRVWPAIAGAMLFAIHPLQVETVAWVTGMRDLLSGALTLLAIWQYLLFVKPADPKSSAGKNRAWLHYAVATAACALALLAKPSAVVTPLLALLAAKAVFGRWPRRRDIALLLPWLAMALAIVLITRAAQPIRQPADGGRWWLRPFIATDAIAFYLQKLVFPLRLGILYDHAPATLIAHGWLYVTWLIPAALCAMIWILRRRMPALPMAFAFFVAALLPVLGLIPFEFQIHSTVADHYVYVALLAPALVLAWLLSRHPTRAPAAVCTILLALFAIRAAVQTLTWEGSIPLFENALRINPASHEACNNLALAYENADRIDDALRTYQAGLKSDPTCVPLHTNLAALLAGQHRYEAAAQEYAAAQRLDPASSAARIGLAALQNRRRPSAPPSRTADKHE